MISSPRHTMFIKVRSLQRLSVGMSLFLSFLYFGFWILGLALFLSVQTLAFSIPTALLLTIGFFLFFYRRVRYTTCQKITKVPVSSKKNPLSLHHSNVLPIFLWRSFFSFRLSIVICDLTLLGLFRLFFDIPDGILWTTLFFFRYGYLTLDICLFGILYYRQRPRDMLYNPLSFRGHHENS